MKKTLLLALLCTSLAVFNSTAQSVLINYWNFNNYTRNDTFPHFTPIKANYSIIDTNKAQIVYQAQPGYDPTSYDGVTYLGSYTATDTLGESVNLRRGDSIGNSMRVANPSDSLELLFYIPSTGYKNLVFQFISYPSSTGSGQMVQNYDYSTDSGSTWKSTGLSRFSDTFYSKIWRLDNLTFGDDTTVNNNPGLVFRIRFAVQTTGTSGNNRFDNVTLDGDSITTAVVDTTTDTTHTSGVAQVNTNAAGCTVFPNPAGNSLTIITPDAGDKTIELYNIIGQKVIAVSAADKQSSLDVSMLAPGMYYVHVRLASGTVYVTRITKN